MENIIVAAGAHASTYLGSNLNAHVRPDISFKGIGPWAKWQDYTLKSKPNKEQLKVFYKRTKNFIKFDMDKTIEENFLMYINKLRKKKTYCVLCGSISLLGDFFLNNRVKVIYLSRHPLNAMCSFMTRRHPETLKQLNTNLNSKKAVEFYAGFWNAFVKEHIEMKNTIVRFEYTNKDSRKIKDEKMRRTLSGIRNNSHKMLNKKFENYLKELVSENYFKIYKRWDI
jgi:hypothetical protein